MVGKDGRFLEACAGSHTEGKHAYHRISGAGYIEYLFSLRRKWGVDDPAAFFKKTYSLLASGNEHRFEIITLEQLCPGIAEVVFISNLHAHSPTRLVVIRCNDVKSLVYGKIVMFRIYANNVLSSGNNFPDPIQQIFGNDPLVVIGNDNCSHIVTHPFDIGYDLVYAARLHRRPAFPVESNYLLSVGDNPRLKCSRPVFFNNNTPGI